MIKIYSDFNHGTEEGFYLLDIPGSLADIQKNKENIKSGVGVILYDEELEVDAVLAYDARWKSWIGIIKPDVSFREKKE